MALSAPPSTMILGPATARVNAERPRGRMRDDGEDEDEDEDGDFAAAFPRTVAADGSDDAEDATTCIMIRDAHAQSDAASPAGTRNGSSSSVRRPVYLESGSSKSDGSRTVVSEFQCISMHASSVHAFSFHFRFFVSIISGFLY